MNIFEYINVAETEKPLDRIVTDGGFCGIFRTIGCIGDSLSSGEFESVKSDGAKGYHDFYEYSWGQFIGRSCGSKVYNFSRGGMTAEWFLKEYAESCGVWSEEKHCQAYIIALGVNDIINQRKEFGSIADICKDDYTKNAQTFVGHYAMIIQKIKKLQPRAKIFLVSTPKEVDDRDSDRKKIRDFLEELTRFFSSTYLIDLYNYAPIYDADFKEKFFLGHMTATGYILTARMIESYIDYIIRKNPKDFNQVGFIGTDLYYNPEE
jgi:lysophospholipase L1-like esterase